MKKTLVLLVAVLSLAISASALELRVGGFFGMRTMNDAAIKDIYGEGTVLYPIVQLDILAGLGVGASYELYDRSGTVQPYGESSRLKITGLEGFLSYSINLKIVRPYVRAGFGSYDYEQTVESDYLAGYKVKAPKTAPHFAAGVVLKILKPVYFAVEAKYVPLKVRPFEDEVDLGGWRFSAGLGLAFGI